MWAQLLIFLELEQWPLPALSQPANAGLGEADAVKQATRRMVRAELAGTYQWTAQRYGLGWD